MGLVSRSNYFSHGPLTRRICPHEYDAMHHRQRFVRPSCDGAFGTGRGAPSRSGHGGYGCCGYLDQEQQQRYQQRDRADAIHAETSPAARLVQDNADRVAAPTQVMDWRFQTLNSKHHMLIQVRQRQRNQDRPIVSDASAMDILLMCVRQTLIVLYATKIIHIFRKKPDASMFGFGKNELGFFRIPDFDFNVETADPSPTGLVKVTRGKLPAEIVQAELGELIRI